MPPHRRAVVLVLVVAAVALPRGPRAAGAPGDDPVAGFLARHWASPLAPQGPAPAGFSPLEASLAPESCGTCHPAQLADWRESVHAAAMGPGVLGQLVEMLAADPATALSCQTCHAPLAEQSPLARDAAGGLAPNPDFDPALRARGIPCAACHVRGHRRFGPPRRDGSLGPPAGAVRLPHDGATRTRAFLDARFCAGCHQFGPGGAALEGVPLENTFEEWRASRYARRGVQCQDCHMPARRHRWRGIHDPAMVRRGVTVTATAGSRAYRVGDTAVVTLTVTNTGVGHAFPTYVTPDVVMSVELVDRAGRVISESRAERAIGREITLDLTRQVRDTRLAPGRAAALAYRHRVDRPGLVARAQVVVYPDRFYTRFFEALLAQGAGQGARQIEEALAATRRSTFTLFAREIPLDRD